MEIKSTKLAMREMLKKSEELKRGFASMVLLAPQILDEEDIRELREEADILAANFESIASFAYTFGRLTPNSQKWIPKMQTDR